MRYARSEPALRPILAGAWRRSETVVRVRASMDQWHRVGAGHGLLDTRAVPCVTLSRGSHACGVSAAKRAMGLRYDDDAPANSVNALMAQWHQWHAIPTVPAACLHGTRIRDGTPATGWRCDGTQHCEDGDSAVSAGHARDALALAWLTRPRLGDGARCHERAWRAARRQRWHGTIPMTDRRSAGRRHTDGRQHEGPRRGRRAGGR